MNLDDHRYDSPPPRLPKLRIPQIVPGVRQRRLKFKLPGNGTNAIIMLKSNQPVHL